VRCVSPNLFCLKKFYRTAIIKNKGLVTHIDQKVHFTGEELTHEAWRVEIFYEDKKPVV